MAARAIKYNHAAAIQQSTRRVEGSSYWEQKYVHQKVDLHFHVTLQKNRESVQIMVYQCKKCLEDFRNQDQLDAMLDDDYDTE